MSCPSAIGVRSTSIGAPAAIVAASGFIWETSGQTVAAAPTAATAPVATKRKSRRVGWSAEDAVVTIPSPFLSAASRTAPDPLKARSGSGCRRPRPPRRQKNRFSSPNPAEQAVQNRSIGTLAGRAQARYRLASAQCTKSAPDRDLFNTFHPAEGPRALYGPTSYGLNSVGPGMREIQHFPANPGTAGHLPSLAGNVYRYWAT